MIKKILECGYNGLKLSGENNSRELYHNLEENLKEFYGQRERRTKLIIPNQVDLEYLEQGKNKLNPFKIEVFNHSFWKKLGYINIEYYKIIKSRSPRDFAASTLFASLDINTYESFTLWFNTFPHTSDEYEKFRWRKNERDKFLEFIQQKYLNTF